MSKRKGLSLEDKRKAMMELFYEKKDFFQLKELEKIAPKEKGVVQGSVKDVVQSLVDDGMVDTDKIGTSVYFWAFPSKASNIKKQKLSHLKSRHSELLKHKNDFEARLMKHKESQKDADRQDQLLQKLKTARDLNSNLKEKLKQFEDLDPDTINQIKEESMVTVTEANKWTDNIYAVKSWCKNKFFMEENQLNKAFGIPEDLDYL